MDSLAPARSVLTGLWLRQTPFAVSQTSQVKSINPAVAPQAFGATLGNRHPQIHQRCKTGVAASRQRAAIFICQENPAFSRKPLRGIGCSNSFRVFSFPFVTQRRCLRTATNCVGQRWAERCNRVAVVWYGGVAGGSATSHSGDAAPPPYRSSIRYPLIPTLGSFTH